jgi:hypothetical protein
MSDGLKWELIRINQEGEYAMQVYDTRKPGGYTDIAATLAFMMQEVVTLAPYASKNHLKKASLFLILGLVTQLRPYLRGIIKATKKTNKL